MFWGRTSYGQKNFILWFTTYGGPDYSNHDFYYFLFCWSKLFNHFIFFRLSFRRSYVYVYMPTCNDPSDNVIFCERNFATNTSGKLYQQFYYERYSVVVWVLYWCVLPCKAKKQYQQTQTMCITVVQLRPTPYKCYRNVLCLLWYNECLIIQTWSQVGLTLC